MLRTGVVPPLARTGAVAVTPVTAVPRPRLVRAVAALVSSLRLLAASRPPLLLRPFQTGGAALASVQTNPSPVLAFTQREPTP